MKKLDLAIIPLFLVSTQANANDTGTVYLDCEMNGNPWKVSLNEAASRIAYTHRNGVVFEQAVFTADAVTWQTRAGTFTISRTDLSLTFDYGDDVSRNTCKLASVPPRKF